MAVPGALADPSTVTGDDISIPVGDGAIAGYLARPTEPGTRPGIIVIHEAFGPNDHIRDLARRFAGAGFNVVAPDLYDRIGAPDPADMTTVMTKLFQMDDAQAVVDLEASAALLRGLDGATDKVGCIGFCSGGRQTLLFACSSAAVDAAVDCWGGFIDKASPQADTLPTRPTRVIDLAAGLGCPLLAVGGGEDANPSPDTLAELEERVSASGGTVTVRVFEGAGHAFLADYRPSYHEGAAHALWPEVIDFFHQHLY